jgi:hybrid cluster-associated redox disulfide protein
MAEKITKDTTIAELIGRSPRLAEAVKRITGSDCAECPAAKDETVELYAILHGLDPEELVRELNSVEL